MDEKLEDLEDLEKECKPITLKELELLCTKPPELFEKEIAQHLKENTLVEMKQSEIILLKNYLHNKQNKICPLLKVEVPLDKVALDHQHKLKNVNASKENGGLVRGAIDFRANALEGKIVNGWKRLFGTNEENYPITLPDYLRNLADYLESPPCEPVYIHPNEVTDKRIPFNQNDYNRIKKYWSYLFPNKKIISPPSLKLKKKNKYMSKEMIEVLPLINNYHLKVTTKIYKKLSKADVKFIIENYFKVYKTRKTYHIHVNETMYFDENTTKVYNEIQTQKLQGFI